jgi:hypothetical protein
MANIKVGDNGTVLELSIKDGGAIVPLNGATVQVVVKAGDRRLVKDAIITDAVNGVCEVTLTATDLATTGMYSLQGVLKRSNGNEFASDIETFTVTGRL